MSEHMPASEDWQEQFEAAWADREERLYPSLFGPMPREIYPLGMDSFEGMPQESTVDPRWLTHGIFECPPTAERPSWVYVSSGLSNCWEADAPDRESVAGLGCEFLMETPAQSRWTLLLLRRMVAFELCLNAGRFPGRGLLSLWDRIPLRNPIDSKDSRLTFLLITPATRFPGSHQTLCGRFEFLQFVGITEGEAAFAREHSSDVLYPLLLQNGAAPVTRPERNSIF